MCFVCACVCFVCFVCALCVLCVCFVCALCVCVRVRACVCFVTPLVRSDCHVSFVARTTHTTYLLLTYLSIGLVGWLA